MTSSTTPIGGPEDCLLERVRGDDKPLVVTLKDPVTDAVIDVTGYTGVWTISTEKNPVDTTNQQAQISGIPSSTPSDGKMIFSPTVSDMDLVGTFYYDIQITDNTSKILTVLKGKIKMIQDITKV